MSEVLLFFLHLTSNKICFVDTKIVTYLEFILKIFCAFSFPFWLFLFIYILVKSMCVSMCGYVYMSTKVLTIKYIYNSSSYDILKN